MDILYYSNHCKHSKKILHSCSRSNVGDKVSFICIDRRKIDHSTGKTIIPLENGTQVVMPPSLAFVPAMLLVNEKYRIIYGDAIIEYLRPMLTTGDNISQENREPESYGFGGAADVRSESFTLYDMTAKELEGKSESTRRPMHNYVRAYDNVAPIQTPPENYSSNKLGDDVTVDKLQQQRAGEISTRPIPPTPDFTY